MNVLAASEVSGLLLQDSRKSVRAMSCCLVFTSLSSQLCFALYGLCFLLSGCILDWTLRLGHDLLRPNVWQARSQRPKLSLLLAAAATDFCTSLLCKSWMLAQCRMLSGPSLFPRVAKLMLMLIVLLMASFAGKRGKKGKTGAAQGYTFIAVASCMTDEGENHKLRWKTVPIVSGS